MSRISSLSHRLITSLWFKSSGQAMITPAQSLVLPPEDPDATVPAGSVLLGQALVDLSAQDRATADPAKALPEGLLLQHLYAMTEAKPFVRALTTGLEALQQESDGRIGFQIRLGRQLNLPLRLIVGRPQQPTLEPLATIQAGIAGNMIFRSCATQLSTPACRPRDTRAVLGNLRRQACQLHLL